jgi:biotin carboxyl carrier protein
MENLILNVNGKDMSVVFDKGTPGDVYVNDKLYQVEMLKELSRNIYSFSVNQKLLTVELDFNENHNVFIMYNGLSFEVSVTDSTKRMLEKFIKQGGGVTNSEGLIKAPMPGMVVKIMVAEGDEVQEGDKVVIVEAMKMENALKSPVAGVVKKIYAMESQAVEKNAILIEIEHD